MKFAFYHRMDAAPSAGPALGIVNGEYVVDIKAAFALPLLFSTIPPQLGWIMGERHSLAERRVTQIVETNGVDREIVFRLDDLRLVAAPPRVASLRDFYAFEEHVRNARAQRNLEMIAEWYEMPVFYFSNPHAIYGPGDAIPYPKRAEWLDFELEIAAIIGRPGIDIPVQQAEAYIAGYTIMNDWSARDIQRQEMKVGLGPAKGKDFATSLGPWIVTPDELEDRRAGKGYDLQMVARRNGVEISRGNWKTIYWSFAEMIAHASEDCMLYPGDVIGSGTVGTGCILELGPERVGGWLRPGDLIELEVERLGVLRNVVGTKRA